MIDGITIKNVASFDEAGQNLSAFKKVNFLYGANGSGKTTLSRVIANQDGYSDCSVVWAGGNKLQSLVYNRDFVTQNFNPDSELKGIFTLGEVDASVVKSIESAKAELDTSVEKIKAKKNTLGGDDDAGGKKSELASLEAEFAEQCWQLKTKYDDDFKSALAGVRDKKIKFKGRLVNEAENNTATLHSFDVLMERAKTVFADEPAKEEIISPLHYADLVALENAAILTRKVIGKDDVDIAAMIKKLGNSDWVKMGRGYFEQNDDHCPFCQQETDAKFVVSLAEYFDESYLNDIASIETLATDYDTLSEALLQWIDAVLGVKPKFLDCDAIKTKKDVVDERVTTNKRHIGRKKKEASTIVTLSTLKDYLDEISAAITAANQQAKAHNATIDNLAKEKRDLSAQIWRFLVEEIKATFDPYVVKKTNLDAAIKALEMGILEEEGRRDGKIAEIQNLEKQITSIQPTIDVINKLLSSFGFSGFSLAKSKKGGFYKIIRSDGTDAQESLSEGEKTFVTFLYFYHLLKGSNTESGMTEDRVVVFDDPVSSLDSDILFIVSNLIKGVFEDVRLGSGHIKQVFVLTHNIYFHKEISFNKRCSSGSAMGDETFWIIKKHGTRSTAESYESNPIKTSYELLWSELRGPNKSGATVQNVMRRIIEHYFKMMGGVDVNSVANKFDGKEKIICGSLISWMHDGSHFAHDDLYVTCDDDTVDKYLEVFRDIFDKSDHLAHYNMMMGIS